MEPNCHMVMRRLRQVGGSEEKNQLAANTGLGPVAYACIASLTGNGYVTAMTVPTISGGTQQMVELTTHGLEWIKKNP